MPRLVVKDGNNSCDMDEGADRNSVMTLTPRRSNMRTSQRSVNSNDSDNERRSSFFGSEGIYQERSDGHAAENERLWAELTSMAGHSDATAAAAVADDDDDDDDDEDQLSPSGDAVTVGTPSNSTRTTKTEKSGGPSVGLDAMLRFEGVDHSCTDDDDTDGQGEVSVSLPPTEKSTRGLSADVIDTAFSMHGTMAAQSGIMDQAEEPADAQDGSPKPTPEEAEAAIPKHGFKGAVARLIEKPIWQIWFMGLTFYSLFSPDIDMLVGTKESGYNLSIVTTVVFGMFLVELVLQSIAKQDYPCRAYFWLDLVALASLLPDTWLVQAMSSNNEFVAARSSKISRIVRVASRSSKATRLNRLTRIVRVASLIPRLAVACGYRKKTDELKTLVEKKLHNLFVYMDDDADGFITAEMMTDCINKFKRQELNEDEDQQTVQREDSALTGRTEKTEKTEKTQTEAMTPRSVSSAAASATPTTQMSATPTTKNRPSLVRTMLGTGSATVGDAIPDLVSFDYFRRALLENERVRARLFASCREQLKRSNNMQKIASRHSEDLGVKVALGVLLLLLVQGLVEPTVTDNSDILGLKHLDTEAHGRFANWSGTVPETLQRHIGLWSNDGSVSTRRVLYLDLRHHEYCNEFVADGNSCQARTKVEWSPRKAMSQIDSELMASGFRLGDLVMLRLPTSVEDAAHDMTNKELNSTVTSLAVLSIRDSIEAEARISLVTTAAVIVIIFSGIMLLTKDMTYLSRRLLKPLRNLADEMHNIVHLQLAGLEEGEQGEVVEQHNSIAEIRLIQSIFDKMKKAIKSWGKYVPWPVVQILLKAGEGATAGVREQEVTVFFSDIASFTTIVETLPPEQSLLLLSRYFHDMSKVIDDHQGIVIEFIGDAILSVYGAPMANEDHATSAVSATLRMLRDLDKLNRWSSAKGLPEVKIRCGVHSGSVLIGNMGFHSRMKYGVVGENASIPSRLEEMNKDYGTDMLVSQSTLSKLKRGAFVVRPIDIVYLRTGAKAEVVYQVLARSSRSSASRSGKLKAVATRHAQAMVLYRKRQFTKSAGLFADVNLQMQELVGVEEDQASALMVRRCQAYAQRPPRKDWDGVWDGSEPPG